MRGLLLSTSAIALLCLAPLATATYAADKPSGVEKTTSEKLNDAWASFKQGAEDTWNGAVKSFDELTRKSQQDVVLPKALPGALSAKTLIGMPIENGKEGRVGSISDVVLGSDSRVDAIVVSDGGFLGINNAQIAVKPSLISIHRDDKGNLKARTNVTESQLDAASSAAFTTRIQAMKDDFKKPEVMTASRLIGASINGPDGKSVGSVQDILMSPVGEARYALVSTGGTMGVGAKVVAVPLSSLTFTKADQPLTTKMTAADLGKLAPVRTQASAT